MATILAKVDEDGTITRIRELKPQAVSSRRGRLSRKTLNRYTAGAESGARRNASPYQVRSVASGHGVLMDPGTITTRSPQLERTYGRPAGHLTMPDISPEKMWADIAVDLQMHRAEVARRKHAEKVA